ncbi:hypothetical protein Golomagni_07577, partial [Golovinomyces magnicellulatus]
MAAVAAASPVGKPVDDKPKLPSQDGFYEVPRMKNLKKTKPGQVLKVRDTPAPIAALGVVPLKLKASKQILYSTLDNFGKPTATVMTVLVPHSPNYSKLVSYQFAEDAAALDCAPSYSIQLSTGGIIGDMLSKAEVLLINAALSRGWIVTIPDHEGPDAAFLARNMSGHAILDGVRAALDSHEATGIYPAADVALWGYSGGGLATAAAVEMHKSYAPEVNIIGAAMGGTVPNFADVLETITSTRHAGLAPAGMQGLANVYSKFGKILSDSLKPNFKSVFKDVREYCLIGNYIKYTGDDVKGYFKDYYKAINSTFVRDMLHENSLGLAVPKVPVLVYHAEGDDVTPAHNTDELVKYYCDNGAPSVVYHKNTKADHLGMSVLGAPRVLEFLDSVMDGDVQKKGCRTETSNATEIDPKSNDGLSGILGAGVMGELGTTKTGPMGI